MITNAFGKSGVDVTKMGYGAWGIGSSSYGKVEDDQAKGALDAYIQGGGNFIDTARGYGESERIIGEFLADNNLRDHVFLCSKSWPHEEEKIRNDLETSLRLLQTDVIDLYYIHNPPDDPSEMNRLLDLFEEFKADGKIKMIGASIKGSNVGDETIALHHQYIDTGRIDAIQLIFSIFRQKNREIFEKAASAGVALVGRTCLENGFLAGKYKPGHTFPEGDHRARWNGEQLDRILETVQQLNDELVKPPFETMAQAALRFVYEEDGLATMIPGAKSATQARSNLSVTNLPPLDTTARARLVEQFADGEQLMNLE